MRDDVAASSEGADNVSEFLRIDKVLCRLSVLSSRIQVSERIILEARGGATGPLNADEPVVGIVGERGRTVGTRLGDDVTICIIRVRRGSYWLYSLRLLVV